jgi:hypothetical protein
MTGALGPRDLGSIISDTFRICGKNFLKLAAIAAIVEVIIYVASFVLGFPYFPGFMGGTSYNMFDQFSVLLLVPLMLLFSVVVIIASVLLKGALIHAVSEQSLDRSIGIGRSYGFAWKRFGSMLGAAILVALAIVGMSITIIGIPFAVYFGVRWNFVVQAALLEGVGPRAALSRSSAIVKGYWWRVLGITLVVAIIGLIVTLGLWFIPFVGSVIGSILVVLFSVTAATLLYYDLRFRKSGYNTETLALELGVVDETQ